MITMWVWVSQAGWAQDPGSFWRDQCAREPLLGSTACECVRIPHPTNPLNDAWWDRVMPPAIAGSCLDVNALLMGHPELERLRKYLEARAYQVARAQGWRWTPTGLVSQKCVEVTLPSVAVVGWPGAWTLVAANGDTIATIGDPTVFPNDRAFLGNFDGGQFEDDYLLQSADGGDLWIAHGPFTDPYLPMYVKDLP